MGKTVFRNEGPGHGGWMRLPAKMKPVGWFGLGEESGMRVGEEGQALSTAGRRRVERAEEGRPMQGRQRMPTSADTAASLLPPHSRLEPGTQLSVPLLH